MGNTGIKKRKVCFIITSFIHYSRNFLVLEELNKRKDVDLHVVVGGTALLTKYSAKVGHIIDLLSKTGFKNIHEVYFNLEGDTPTTKAKTTGLGIIEFANIFNEIKPDLVVVRGDRFEVLSATTAASLMNIAIAHIEGGDVTGSIDESVRHAITKMSHIHFPTNKKSKERIISMGEDSKSVFDFGSPDIEIIKKLLSDKEINVDPMVTGSGAEVDIDKDFLMVMYHSVWSESMKDGSVSANTRNLLTAIKDIGMQTIWFWPNFDVGSEEISQAMRNFNDTELDHTIRFMRYLPPKEFLTMLSKTKCLIGNSSAGIKESSYLGTPVVNIGLRQNGRTRAGNVVDAKDTTASIKNAINSQLKHGGYKKADLYSKPDTAKNIAKVVAKHPLYIQKSFIDSK